LVDLELIGASDQPHHRDDLITRVDQLLDLDAVLVPGRQELGPEAADAVVPAVLLARQERVRGRDPLDLRIEDLSYFVEPALHAPRRATPPPPALVHFSSFAGPRALDFPPVDAGKGGEQPAHGLDVLLRHRPL